MEYSRGGNRYTYTEMGNMILNSDKCYEENTLYSFSCAFAFFIYSFFYLVSLVSLLSAYCVSGKVLSSGLTVQTPDLPSVSSL